MAERGEHASQLRFEPEPGHTSVVRVVFEHVVGEPMVFRLAYPEQGQVMGGPTRAEENCARLNEAAEPLNLVLRYLGG